MSKATAFLVVMNCTDESGKSEDYARRVLLSLQEAELFLTRDEERIQRLLPLQEQVRTRMSAWKRANPAFCNEDSLAFKEWQESCAKATLALHDELGFVAHNLPQSGESWKLYIVEIPLGLAAPELPIHYATDGSILPATSVH